ncbi:MAG: GTP-binding protein [Promethearchaeota archaeon]|nr:MAG: GTP-binding protein [Candidatus Lokiarchaeota archaeon]
MTKNYIYKVLISGDASVGKTSLLRRYVDDMFDESSIMTVGVDFFLKKVNFDSGKSGKNFLLQLWDLGGQERFRHLIPTYIRGARGALLLIDLTRMPEKNSLSEWVNILRLYDINLPIILVGTKNDLEDLIAFNDKYAVKIKKRFNMIDYIKTSAKTGYNIKEVFNRMAKELIEKEIN